MYKNNVLIKEYDTHSDLFPHLLHGPVPVDDLIGDEMKKNEGYSDHKNELVKICLNETAIHGYKITAKVAWAALRLILFHGMKPQDAVDLFQRYIGDWGGESKEYRFDAIKDGKVVKSVVKAPMTKVQLGLDISSTELLETNTYDVAQVRVIATDEYTNLLPFFEEAMVLETEGPIEVIGPNVVPFRGGMAGIYVKSCFEEGDGILRITCESAGTVEIKFHVGLMYK